MTVSFPGLMAGLIGLGVLLVSACETTRIWQPDITGPSQGELLPGDLARVRLRDGLDLDLRVTAVDDIQVTGIDPAGTRHILEWKQINVIEISRTDPLRTTAAMAGATVFAVLAAGLIVLLATFGAL